MKFRHDFLKQRPNKTVSDLKVEITMKKTKEALSKILKNQNQKLRNEKAKREVSKLLEGY